MKRVAGLLIAALASGCTTPSTPVIHEDSLTAGIFLDLGGKAALPEGVALRPDTPEGLQLTEQSEKFVGHLYDDAADFCTIGYGHLVKYKRCDGTEPAQFLKGLTLVEGADWLEKDMGGAQIAVQMDVKVQLTDDQFAALCDFVFNVGPSKFSSSTLLHVINQKQFDRVPAQMQRWDKAGGQVLPGLKARRDREAALFGKGQLGEKGAPPEDEDLSEIDIRVGEPQPR